MSTQFQWQKQFCFKQFSLTLVHSLNMKTVLFKVIQFSMKTQFSSIWPIERALLNAATPDKIRPGSDGKEGVLSIL